MLHYKLIITTYHVNEARQVILRFVLYHLTVYLGQNYEIYKTHIAMIFGYI